MTEPRKTTPQLLDLAEANQRLKRGWMSEEAERVRFVLRAQMHETGVQQARLVTKVGETFPLKVNGKPVTNRTRLSRLLTSGDVVGRDLEVVRSLERLAIHNSFTSRYAESILNFGKHDRRGDSRWWSERFSRQMRYETPLEVIVAGLSLLKYVHEVGFEHSTSSLETSTARQHLTYALCRVASGNLGFAHEAMVILASLGPVVSKDTANFMVASPMGGWVARAADGAIRRSAAHRTEGADPRLLRAYRDATHRTAIDPDTPSRCIAPIRLLRRLAVDGEPQDQAWAFDRLVEVARNTSMPPRWRRFAVWVAAEPAARAPRSSVSTRFDGMLDQLRDDRDVSDVVDRLLGVSAESLSTPPGCYKDWTGSTSGSFDLTTVDHRNAVGGFEWPIPQFPATNELLHKFTLRGYESGVEVAFSEPLRRIGLDIRLRLLDVLHETLVHPGYIRVQSAIDMLHAAGPRVLEATALSLTAMLSGDEGKRLDETSHLPSFLDSSLLLLGRTRLARALPALLAATNWCAPHLRASAIWSIGDVMSNIGEYEEALRWEQEAADVLSRALDSTELVIQRAAIHTIAVGRTPSESEPHRFKPRFQHQIEQLSSGGQVSDWARWCLLLWSDHYLNTHPTVHG